MNIINNLRKWSLIAIFCTPNPILVSYLRFNLCFLSWGNNLFPHSL